MAEITTAWVYVPTMGINSKQMKFDEVRADIIREHRRYKQKLHKENKI